MEEEQKRAIFEERLRAEYQVRALLEKARQRLRLPTQGRRLDAQDLLRQIAEPRRKVPPGEVAEALDLEARSVFAATLAVPDLRVLERVELPVDAMQAWPTAMHPSGERIAIGTPNGPVLWALGRQPRLPEQLDPQAPRPRLAYSPDGEYLVLMPAGGGLEVWDDSARGLIRRLDSNSSVFLAVGFDRDGRKLWACRADGQVVSWSLPDFQPAAGWTVPGVGNTQGERIGPRLTAAAFTADASRLAVGDKSGRVILCQSGGTKLREFPAASLQVQALAWSSDEQLVAVGSRDGTSSIWRAADGFRLYLLPGYNAGIDSVLFSPDDHWLLTGVRHSIGKIWDVVSGEPVLTGCLTVGGWARHGNRIACSGIDACFKEFLQPDVVRRLCGRPVSIGKLAWARDSRHLVSLDCGYEVRVWDVERSRLVDAFQAPAGSFYAMNAAVALSDDSQQVAYCGGGESQALIREVSSGRMLAHGTLPRGFETLACVGPGKFLLVREQHSNEQEKSLESAAWMLEVGKAPVQQRILRPHVPGEKEFLRSDLTPDGRYYCWTGPRQPARNRRCEVRDVATGQLIHCFHLPQERENPEPAAVLGPDGQTLFLTPAGSDRTWLHDLSGRALALPQRFVPLALSPDSRWLAAQEPITSVTYTYLYCGTTTWIALTGPDQGFPEHMIFSPDSRYLAWGSESGVITVVDLHGLGDEIRKFEAVVLPQ
jgi:WD40 repeat protein